MAPKAVVKQEKKDYVGTLAQKLSTAKSVVFVDYAGMGVTLQQDFKSKLREVGGTMLVAKNTLLRLAVDQANIDKDLSREEVLKEQTAVVLSGEDAVASIQILGKFSKDNEIPKIKSGIVEGVYLDQARIVRISSLPSKEQLQANVVGTIGAPLYGLVGVLQGNLQKLVYILQGVISDGR
jgi:large subunit ribosomal protein L10